MGDSFYQMRVDQEAHWRAGMAREARARALSGRTRMASSSANYLIWFEIGRTEFCRARGFAYRDMEENSDAFLVVAESYCRYKAPAYYDDELIVRTHITEKRRRALRFGYEIVRASDSQVIAEGETGHVVTDGHGRVRSFPEAYNQLLSSSPVTPKFAQRNDEIAPDD